MSVWWGGCGMCVCICVYGVYGMFSVWYIWDMCCMYGISVVDGVYECV